MSPAAIVRSGMGRGVAGAAAAAKVTRGAAGYATWWLTWHTRSRVSDGSRPLGALERTPEEAAEAEGRSRAAA